MKKVVFHGLLFLGLTLFLTTGAMAADAQTAKNIPKEKSYRIERSMSKEAMACIECHMPFMVKSAVGDAEKYTGDIRSHLMKIDPYQIEQFSEDGSVALSQIGLNFACRHCHGAGLASEKTDEELTSGAVGYHDRPAP